MGGQLTELVKAGEISAKEKVDFDSTYIRHIRCKEINLYWIREGKRINL